MDHFLPKLLPGLVVGVIKADAVILLSDFRRRGEGHMSLEATRALATLGWAVQEIRMVSVP